MRARFVLTALCLDLGIQAAPVMAQTENIGSTAAAVYPDEKAYKLPPVQFGSLSLQSKANVRLAYDSNVYAAPTSAQDDVYYDLSAGMRADVSGSGPVSFKANATATIRRYADRTTENSERWRLDGTASWAMSPTSDLSLMGMWQRAVEDRGDSEARIDPNRGPRQIDVLSTELNYHATPGRLMFDVQASATRYDALSALDDDRDFSAFNGQATLGLRMTGSLFATGTAFVNRRQFRLSRTASGIERDTTTYGGRLGVNIEPGGPIEGRMAVGVFRFAPDAPTGEGRTGLSVSGSLIYRPSRRTALLLNAFNGDVATFRTGAQSRTDTRVRFTVQQEIRHNLFANIGAGYRKSKFIGTGISENTATLSGEVEYVLSPNFSISANADVAKRTSDRAAARFERFRTAVSLRFRF